MNFKDFIIETNLFISSAALLLTVETQIQLGIAPQWHPYLFIIFFATMFEYNFHRLVTIIIRKEALQNEKNKWIREHLYLFYGVVLVSVLGFVVAIFLAKIKVLMALAPIAAITVFYSFPLFKKRNFIFRLREIPLLKIFLIAFVWSAVTILLPVIHSELQFERSELWWMFIERFVFVFAITIPFDIRDMAVDRLSGIHTIPLMLGAKRASHIAVAGLLVFMLLAVFHYRGEDRWYILAAFIITAIITLYFITNKKLQGSKYYYYGLLDGTMVLQGVLVIVAYYFHNLL